MRVYGPHGMIDSRTTRPTRNRPIQASSFAKRVSTPVGCEGIDGVHGQHLLIADRAHFADAVAEVLLDPAAAEARAERAQQLAKQSYDWSAVGRRAIDGVACASAAIGRKASTFSEVAVQTEIPIR